MTRSTQKPISPWRWLWIAVGGVLVFMIIIVLLGKISLGDSSVVIRKKVGIVRVTGPILTSESTVKALDECEERDDVAAVVLRIDSPGGGIGPSQEIYERVKRLNEQKPIVTSMASVAASGGYYISLGSEKIMANPGTITGSIGVIMEYPVVTDLMDHVGIQVETIKSGELKDAGSPTREVTEEDRIYFSEVVLNLHDQFIKAVVSARNLEEDKVRELANGRIFTGERGVSLGLIDTLGTFSDAIKLAARLGNIKGKPSIVEVKKKRASFFEWLFENRFSNIKKRLTSPNFEYRWK